MADAKREQPWLRRVRASMLTTEELRELRRKAKENDAFLRNAFERPTQDRTSLDPKLRCCPRL